jgi:hypothetical protein
MLAIHSKVETDSITAITLDAANDDAIHHPVNASSIDEVSSTTPWLADWTRAWTAAAASMIDASAASIQAIGSAASARPLSEPTKSEVSLWSQAATPSRPRSWYRPPQPNLLDPTTWGFPAPLSVYGVPVTPQMAMGFNPSMTHAWSPMAGWPGFGSTFGAGFGLPFAQPSVFANPFVRQPENPFTTWMSSLAPQPVSPWASLTKAMTTAMSSTNSPTPYASYRSDSGHAMAQIVQPVAKASSAQEAMVAIMDMFAWPTSTRAH